MRSVLVLVVAVACSKSEPSQSSAPLETPRAPTAPTQTAPVGSAGDPWAHPELHADPITPEHQRQVDAIDREVDERSKQQTADPPLPKGASKELMARLKYAASLRPLLGAANSTSRDEPGNDGDELVITTPAGQCDRPTLINLRKAFASMSYDPAPVGVVRMRCDPDDGVLDLQ